MSNVVASAGWEVKCPSREYRELRPEVRAEIDGYLSEIPVRIGAIARRLGVKVLVSTLPPVTSAQIGQEDGAFVIRLNRNDAKRRQRFTLAHELAHFLLHKDRVAAEGGWSENVLLRSGQPANIEREANSLASDLVIPSAVLAEATAEYSGPMTGEAIEDLARRFGVPTAAMSNKLQVP